MGLASEMAVKSSGPSPTPGFVPFTVFKHLDYCDSKTMSESLFPGQRRKKNSIKRQGALEQKQVEKLQGSGESFKIRAG